MSRFLLVAALAGTPVLASRGDDPKAEEAKKQEADRKAADEKAKREADDKAAAEKAAKMQAAKQALEQAQVAQLVQQQGVVRQQLVLQGRGIQVQPGGFNGGGMPYYTPVAESSNQLKLGPGEVEVKLGDDSVMKVVLLADVLELETAYGKLRVPMADVRRIDVGLRITPDDEKAIAAAIADAGGQDPKKRVAARDVLVGYREKAFAAVKRAASAATGTEAGTFLADVDGRIRSVLPDGHVPSDRDKVVTPGSTFVGKLATPAFKVRTFAFGEQSLQLAAVRSLRTRTADDADDGPVIPWPGSMNPFAGHQGKTFRVRVSAQAAGGVWGTGTYTMDTYLPAAAIHAGVLKPGETGVVKFKIVPSPQIYHGSTQNGLTSGNYPFYQGGAYEILK